MITQMGGLFPVSPVGASLEASVTPGGAVRELKEERECTGKKLTRMMNRSSSAIGAAAIPGGKRDRERVCGRELLLTCGAVGMQRSTSIAPSRYMLADMLSMPQS